MKARRENRSMIASIISNPHSWTPWLEYADWLTVNGQGQAARMIAYMYSVLNGGWGDAELHDTVRRLGHLGSPDRKRCFTSCWPDVDDRYSCMQFMLCPPGEFVMGRQDGATDRDDAGVRVTLTQGFWLASCPVTPQIWQDIMGERTPTGPLSSHILSGVRLPDILEFLRKLNAKHYAPGWRFDLPTEAQWEYACRAGTNTNYSYGNKQAPSLMNYLGTLWGGEFPPYTNPWGFRAMHGSVRELCRDGCVWPLPGGVDPLVPRCQSNRLITRGGCGVDRFDCCYSHARRPCTPLRMPFGFRVALVVDD